ncbi:50S ribosomal protein L18 [Moraxella atlantae]|uniref:Large ribosomal subunit protein uL18 n=1 Tax=Faucicola atlantae TaxID=34059 RepID=A0A1B8QAW0_9GAMM|nr:50S ribosomal protein L18 [Moraxella atlantae]OBX82402.1 50S ribosomal protein L18 [Moraxella atlantae]OPH33982.1 50S ribosomal protein L18 [Moraxella atlantae]STY94708.1 RRP-L18 [Moraxella atlantae]
MLDKKSARLRRAKKTRAHIRVLGANRLSVNRTGRHIYAQVISPTGGEVLAQASTLDASLRSGQTSNIEAATAVGKLIAERAKAAGITKVAFDRSGFKYHGRVKALAEAARENGLEF